jgi:hypothetical protein
MTDLLVALINLDNLEFSYISSGNLLVIQFISAAVPLTGYAPYRLFFNMARSSSMPYQIDDMVS